jgi:hypothetical protein
MNFCEYIKEAKPEISESSCKTYNSLLRSIYKNVFGDTKNIDMRNFGKADKITEWLSAKPFNVRKTYLAALVAIEPEQKKYKEMMLGDINEYNREVNKQELTTKLENSAITQEEIDGILAKLKASAEHIWKKKSYRVPDYMEIQNYVLFSLYYGHVVPRRALDYVEMLYKNYNKETDNYIDLKKNKFVFNKFKTAKFKGTQELAIPPALKKILSKWVSIIPSEIDSLFFNSKLEPLSNVTLNQRLNDIFGGKKSVNSLRHFYLTTKYKDLMIANQKMANEMEDMGSSAEQSKVYIKIHDKE